MISQIKEIRYPFAALDHMKNIPLSNAGSLLQGEHSVMQFTVCLLDVMVLEMVTLCHISAAEATVILSVLLNNHKWASDGK